MGTKMQARIGRLCRHTPFKIATLFLVTLLFMMMAALSAHSSPGAEARFAMEQLASD